MAQVGDRDMDAARDDVGGGFVDAETGEVRQETMIINMGPQHPSTHGVLRLLLELDGEVIVNCIPDIGYLHTGVEKNMEAGVLINGGPVPKILSDHLQALIDVRAVDRA